MPSKRAAKRGLKAGISAGSDGSVELGLNGVPVEPQVTEKPPPEPQATEKPPPEQEEVAMAAGKRAAKRGRKPGIPAASDCSVELGLNGAPVEPQVAEKPPPEPAAEVEDEDAEGVEGSQQSEEAGREQSDLHSSSKEQSEDEDESMEEEAADESAPALWSPSKGRNGVKKPAPSARVVEAKKPPPFGNKRRRRNEEPVPSPTPNKRNMVTRSHQTEVPSPSPNKRSMVTRSHQPEVPAPEEHEPEDKGHEPEDQEEHEPEDEGAGIIKSKKKKKSKKTRKSAQEDNGPEDEGLQPEDPEEHGPEDEGARIVKLKKKKSKKMRKPAPEEHEPEDQGAEVIKSKKRKSDRIKPAQQKEDEEHGPEDPEEHGPEDEGAGIIKGKNKKNKKMRKPAPEEHEPEEQGAEVIKSKKRKSDRIKPAQQQGEPGPSKVKRTRRQWAPNDEILILEQVINYRHTHGGYAPEVQDSSFFESLLKQLGDQSLELRTVKDKMCSLRRRYFKKKHKSTTEHGKRLDNLSEQAWGKLSQVGAKDSSGRNLSKKALCKHSRKDSKSFEEVCEMYPHLAREKRKDCPTSMEDLSAVDSEASVAAESLRAMAAAISNDPQEHQEQHGQQIRARPNTSRWTEAEREMLVTFLDTPKKIQTYYNSKADFSRDTADAMALRLGYEFHCEKVRCKLTKVEQQLNISKADKASIAIFMKGLRSALFDPASSSQSGSMQLPRSKSSVQFPSSNLQRAESVAEAVRSVSEHVDLTLDQRFKYSKAMLVDPTLYLEVFNSFKTIEGKIDFLDKVSAGH